MYSDVVVFYYACSRCFVVCNLATDAECRVLNVIKSFHLKYLNYEFAPGNDVSLKKYVILCLPTNAFVLYEICLVTSKGLSFNHVPLLYVGNSVGELN